MIDPRAFWGTVIVHAAGTLLAISPYAYRNLCPCDAPNRASAEMIMLEPECPDSREVDSPALPDFPLVGTGRPFLWLDPNGVDPEICVLIDRDGRVGEAFVASSWGQSETETALLESARMLRFVPASRSGRPVAAWGRLVVLSRSATTLWRPSGTGQLAAVPRLIV